MTRTAGSRSYDAVAQRQYRIDLTRLMALARACDAAGLSTVARNLADFGLEPYYLSKHVVRAIEYQLRRHLRKDPAADLEGAAALLLLLALKTRGGIGPK